MKKIILLAVYAALGILLFALARESYGPDYIAKVRFKKMLYHGATVASHGETYAWVGILEDNGIQSSRQGIHVSEDGCRANVPVSGKVEYEEGKEYYVYASGSGCYLTETTQSRINFHFCLAVIFLIADVIFFFHILKKHRI